MTTDERELIVRAEESAKSAHHRIDEMREDILGELKETNSRLSRLETVLITGNGDPSLKEQVHTQAKEIADIAEECAKHSGTRSAVQVETAKGKSSFRIALATGILGIVAAGVMAITSIANGGNTPQDDSQSSEVQQILRLLEIDLASRHSPITPAPPSGAIASP